MSNDIHFNSIVVPFDGNGFYPSSNGSSIINLLNTLEYNIISYYSIEEDQIENYNFINDKNKEAIFFLYKIFVSYFMKCDLHTHTVCVPYYKATPYNISHTKIFQWRFSL